MIEKYPEARTEQWPVQEFTYLSPVRCHNTSMKQRTPWAAEYWERADPDYCDGDGAESFAQFIGRVQGFTVKLSGRIESPMLVFTHQMFIAAYLWLNDRSNSDPMEGILKFRKYMLENVVLNAGMTKANDCR